ncbi:MAG: hypothetical protein QOG68_2321, partial [Solirubrobacteraceae bacterium]|nr:hypothetical protein [Solirubrobacteraceae bacterium]
LNRLKPGDPLFDFDPNKFAANFFGFPSGADIKVFLQGNGVHVKVGLKLPSAFLGVNGDVDLVADRETGVHLDSFRIAIPNVALGAVEFRDFELKYNFGLKTWVGKGTLAIAKAGAIAASATFAGGDFKGASIDYQLPAPLPIGPFVYLKRVGGGFMTDPVKIDVTGTIGAGVPVGGEFPITVDGHAGMEFPSEGGAKFQIDGKVYVLLLEVAEGRLRFQIAPGGGGYADFFVQSNQDFEIMSFNAKLEGWVDGRDDSPTKGQMAGDFHGQVCINFVIGCLLKGSLDAAISQKGLAVCGSVSVEDVGFSAGVQFTLDGLRSATETMAATPGIFAAEVGTGIVLAHFHIRCHASDFRVPPPVARSAQAGGGVGLDVPGGLPTESFLVYGDGGVPNVDVVGPGATVAGTAPGEKASKSADGDALAFAPVNAVLVTVEHPKAGTWTVQPRPGSPAIKQVKLSDGYRPAKPAATVVKGRSLRYTIADLGAGQTVRFVESGKFGHRILGDAKSATGSFALPQDGLAAGKRTITALVQHGGLTTDRSVVARYVAPGPAKPARVRSIRVQRSGTTLSARWPAAKGAARYVVTVHGGKRLGLGRIVAGKHVSFDLVPRGMRVTVTVTGLSKDLVRGRARTVRSR